MSEQIWINDKIDRSEWDRGPWDSEPDKVQWKDGATGLDCLAVRHPHSGHWCGYVGVPPGHLLHGKGYDTPAVYPHGEGCESGDESYHYSCTPGGVLSAHGDLTFADECQEADAPCRGVCHVAAPGEPDKLWWLGFDCAHCDDASPRDFFYARTRGYPFSRCGACIARSHTSRPNAQASQRRSRLN
jgi:hypothetical protein